MSESRRYARLAQAKHEAAVPSTPAERLRLADAMLVDAWALSEAARASLSEAPRLPAWQRGRARDAQAHKALQKQLRELFAR